MITNYRNFLSIYEQFFMINDNLWIENDINPQDLSEDELNELITKDKKDNLDKIIHSINSGTKTIINNHTEKEQPLKIIVFLENDYVCQVYDYLECTLNKIYASNDGKLFLSKINIGGLFGKRLYETNDSLKSRIENAILYYNLNHDIKITNYAIL